LQEAIGGAVESPVGASISVQSLAEGNPQDRALAQLLDGLDSLRARLDQMNPGAQQVAQTAVRDLAIAARDFADWRMANRFNTTVSEFLTAVYYSLENAVAPYAYGKFWLLFDAAGNPLDQLQSGWARGDGSDHDLRSLAAVGLRGSTELRVRLIERTSEDRD
jgi:hypothetical protein